MKNQKEKKDFRFVGKGAKDYNNDFTLDLVKETCENVGVKLDAVENSFGVKENVIVKKSAKPDKTGKYKEKDIMARFGDASRCNTFLNGMYAGVKLNKKNKQ